MKINKKTKWTVVILFIVALLGGGYYYYYQNQQKIKSAAAIETADVQRISMKSVVSATGTIRPVDAVEVSSKITARIETVLVKENDTVKSGQTIATLDGKELQTEQDQAAYKVSNTKAKYDRVSYLYSIGASSQEDFEDAQYNYDTAKSSMEGTQSNLDETVIRAPMDGVVVGKPQTPGTMAVQGTSNPTVIMRIADLSRKQIMAKVDETDIGKIQIGQMATFTVDAYTGKTFTAKVSKISQTDVDNTWDTSSTTTTSSSSSSSSSASVIYYYVTLDIDDADNLLKPAMTARVEINTAEKNDALAVPLAALKTNNDGSYVVVVHEDGTTENRSVKTGIYSDEYVEITDGLMESDKVSIAYTASAKKTTSSSNQHQGPPPM